MKNAGIYSKLRVNSLHLCCKALRVHLGSIIHFQLLKLYNEKCQFSVVFLRCPTCANANTYRHIQIHSSNADAFLTKSKLCVTLDEDVKYSLAHKSVGLFLLPISAVKIEQMRRMSETETLCLQSKSGGF